MENELTKEIYKIPIEYTKSVVQGFHNSFIFLGKQGQGKTTIVLDTLIKEKADFIYHGGISTPKALYEFLYSNRDNRIILFDDCAGLINNSYSLSIILSALWSYTEDRIITWNSTKETTSCPREFIFNSRIIIIANKMPKNDYSQVVMSRCLVYHTNLSYQQIIKLMYAIGDKEVVDFLKDNSSEATKNFDLRLLRKAESFKEYDKDNWKELVIPMLERDRELELIVLGMDWKKWCNETGMHRATYFRYKKRLVA